MSDDDTSSATRQCQQPGERMRAGRRQRHRNRETDAPSDVEEQVLRGRSGRECSTEGAQRASDRYEEDLSAVRLLGAKRRALRRLTECTSRAQFTDQTPGFWHSTGAL